MKRSTLIKKSKLIAAGIHEDYFHVTLDNYRGPKHHKEHALNYISNMDEVRKHGLSLLLYGENNSGKTTLSCVIAKAFIINDYDVLVTNLREMTDIYAQGWQDVRVKQDFNTRIRNVGLLVIDDLNKELHNRATASVLDAVLRYRSNRHLPFIITTNASCDELREQYGNSFIALLERRCAFLEFKKSLKETDHLVNRNLALLDSLGRKNEKR